VLKELGFDLAQGNLFSPAVPLADLRALRYAILYQEGCRKRSAGITAH
jgi:hypothetical protein